MKESSRPPLRARRSGRTPREAESADPIERSVLDVIEAFYAKAWSEPDGSTIERLIARTFVMHGARGDVVGGPAMVQRLLQAQVEAFPDCIVELEHSAARDACVIAHWVFRGTPAQHFPGEHAAVEVRGIDLLHVVDGQIKELWGDWDVVTLWSAGDLVRQTRLMH